MSCYAQAPRPVSPYPRTCAPRNPIRRAPYARRRAHVVRTRGVCAKPRRHAGAVRSGARCTRPVHRRHAAQAPQPVSPYPRTCAPRNPICRAPYAEPHTHVRAHAVRTRGVCAKPRRHAGAVRPCAHCITALTLQGSHLSAARHRVALSLYQSHDRDLRSMLEAEPARRRGHQCLHWSSPHRRWWCWWRWCRRRR
jgi:hypothetical protein